MPPAIRLPKWEEVERYFKDPEILTSEILFLFLSLCNVFVMFRLFSDVMPYPIFVTWWQLTQGLGMAYILGFLGKEYPKFAYFPVVEINKNLLKKLFLQTLVYIGMVVLANVVLSKIICVSTFPVVVCFTVVLHHATRFIGCGEEYMALRWYSILLIFLAFVLGCTDSRTISMYVLPFTLLYACFSAAFRGCYLQKIMHIVEGKGNLLHNHQHMIGVCILPLLWIIAGEHRIFTTLPYNFSSIHAWQTWGCLITVGTLPFLKNIISNRLIRRTGQAPWRVLEILSIFLVFVIGLSSCNPGWQGWIATLLLMAGRSVGMYDVLLNTQDAQEGGGNRKSPESMRQRSEDMQSMDGGSQKPFLSAIDEDDDSSQRYYDREASMPA